MKTHRNLGGQQLLVEGALNTLRPGWRERQAKRKSPWNLIGLLVAVLIMVPAAYGLWQCAWKVHVFFYPAHEGHMREFWRAGLSAKSLVSSFLMSMPLFLPTIVIGLLVSNLLIWLIPAARRAMNAEAAGDAEMTFRGANLGLMKWGGIASGFALTLVLIGLATLTSLR